MVRRSVASAQGRVSGYRSGARVPGRSDGALPLRRDDARYQRQ